MDHLPYFAVMRHDLAWDGWRTSLELSTDGTHARVMIQSPDGFPEKVTSFSRDKAEEVNTWVVPIEEVCLAIIHVSRHLRAGFPTSSRCGLGYPYSPDLDQMVGSTFPDPREFLP